MFLELVYFFVKYLREKLSVKIIIIENAGDIKFSYFVVVIVVVVVFGTSFTVQLLEPGHLEEN